MLGSPFKHLDGLLISSLANTRLNKGYTDRGKTGLPARAYQAMRRRSEGKGKGLTLVELTN